MWENDPERATGSRAKNTRDHLIEKDTFERTMPLKQNIPLTEKTIGKENFSELKRGKVHYKAELPKRNPEELAQEGYAGRHVKYLSQDHFKTLNFMEMRRMMEEDQDHLFKPTLHQQPVWKEHCLDFDGKLRAGGRKIIREARGIDDKGPDHENKTILDVIEENAGVNKLHPEYRDVPFAGQTSEEGVNFLMQKLDMCDLDNNNWGRKMRRRDDIVRDQAQLLTNVYKEQLLAQRKYDAGRKEKQDVKKENNLGVSAKDSIEVAKKKQPHEHNKQSQEQNPNQFYRSDSSAASFDRQSSNGIPHDAGARFDFGRSAYNVEIDQEKLKNNDKNDKSNVKFDRGLDSSSASYVSYDCLEEQLCETGHYPECYDAKDYVVDMPGVATQPIYLAHSSHRHNFGDKVVHRKNQRSVIDPITGEAVNHSPLMKETRC